MQTRICIATICIVGLGSASDVSLPELKRGADDCPCIKNRSITSNQQQCKLRNDGDCYADNYGSNLCFKHDEHVTPECAADVLSPPTWCSASWCWINPAHCTLPNSPTSRFKEATLADSGMPLHYSYHTCGSLDTYMSDANHPYHKLLSSFNDGSLRVSFPGTDTYHIINTPGNEDGMYKIGTGLALGQSGKAGASVDFFKEVMQQFGVTHYHIVPISESSRAYSNSTFTQCCHTLALNYTDVCVGNFWPTLTRMYHMQIEFSSMLFLEEFRMISRRASGGNRHFLWHERTHARAYKHVR